MTTDGIVPAGALQATTNDGHAVPRGARPLRLSGGRDNLRHNRVVRKQGTVRG